MTKCSCYFKQDFSPKNFVEIMVLYDQLVLQKALASDIYDKEKD